MTSRLFTAVHAGVANSSISSPIIHPAAGRKNPHSSLCSPDSSYRPFLSHLLKQIPDKEVLISAVQAYMDLKFFLEDLFGRRVDLVDRDTMKPDLVPYILQSVRYVPGI